MTTGAPVRDAATARGGRHSAERQKPILYERRYSSRGPKNRLLSGTMAEYGADPIGSMRRWRDEFGDFVPIRFGPFRAHMAYGRPRSRRSWSTARRTSARASGRGCSFLCSGTGS